jgi:hypothetical protein
MIYHFTKIVEKKHYNHLKSSHYDVCTAAALYILNMLDVMVLENIYYPQMLNMKREEKIFQYSLCIMTSPCKMTFLCRLQCKMMSLCAVSSGN